jgi:hypothetical protein
VLDTNGRAYVMDFGIARSAYLPDDANWRWLGPVMSPEQQKKDR